MPQFSHDSRVGEIVASHPSTSRTFHRFGIDFCCGGGRTLGKACSKVGVDVDQVIDALSTTEFDLSEHNWTNASPTALIAHIVTTFHEPLRSELPRLQEMLEKVHRVHGHIDQQRFDVLLSTFTSFHADLIEHMQKEEEILFPLMMQKKLDAVEAPIEDLEHEHEDAGEALRELRRLTGDYNAPEYACNTWRALWDGLRELEVSMHEHVHLENNVLFTGVGAGAE